MCGAVRGELRVPVLFEQRAAFAGAPRRIDGRGDGVHVMSVDLGDDVPAVGFEPPRRVVGEPALDMPVDGDAIVVVERDQLA